MASAKKTSAAKSPAGKSASKASASKPNASKPAKGTASKASTGTKAAATAKPSAASKASAKPTPSKAAKASASKAVETKASAGRTVAPKAASKSSKASAPAKSAAQEASKPLSTAARLNVRTPEGADELKQKIGALATATGQIRLLKRGLQRSFFDIGVILKDIDDRRLYEVKGYGSFESFLEREIDLGKQLGLRLSRAVEIFQRDAAVAAGLERVTAAIAAFDGEADPATTPAATTPTSSGTARSPIPFHKQ